jgi:transposase-like protein
MSEGGQEAVRADDEVAAKAEVVALQKQIRELQRVLSQKSLESGTLGETVKIADEKTDLAAAVVSPGRYGVRRVALVLGVSRSQLSQRLKAPGTARSSYRSCEHWVDERPTYGCRRITALLNRARRKVGLANVNHKRICRLMSRYGLLLQRYTGRPPDRAHDGIIRTIHPNAR